jgi:organic hydroperoxide reductase OsmC/OhrA
VVHEPSPSDPNGTVIRRGTVSWLTHAPAGRARISGAGGLNSVSVAVPQGDPGAEETTPGELMAITAAMILAWAVAEVLTERKTPANELVVKSECTFSGPVAERQLVALSFRVDGRVPGIHSDGLLDAAHAARRRYLLASGARDDLPCELEATVLEPFD